MWYALGIRGKFLKETAVFTPQKEETMKKYAVAYMNFFDNEIEMVVVEADNSIIAIVKGVLQIIGKEEDAWLTPILEGIPNSDGHANRIREIQDEFFNTNQAVNVMRIS